MPPKKKAATGPVEVAEEILPAHPVSKDLKTIFKLPESKLIFMQVQNATISGVPSPTSKRKPVRSKVPVAEAGQRVQGPDDVRAALLFLWRHPLNHIGICRTS